jgi:hypothetical protein
MGFIRSRYALRWPLSWWLVLWVILLLQAISRTAFWLGHYSASSSQIIDLLTLLLLGLAVSLAPKGAGWLIRMTGLLMAGGILWLLEQGEVLTVLLLLALAHNFTPIALVWDLARKNPQFRVQAWVISGMFILPVLIACSGWTGAVYQTQLAGFATLLDGQLPNNWGGPNRQSMLSAIVLAQCLHYYCVIYLLPHAETHRVGKPVMTRTWQVTAIATTTLILGYFLVDYSAARKLYAIAAGMHAWLEWPVLLMAFLCAENMKSAKV